MREHKWAEPPKYTFEFCLNCGAVPNPGKKKRPCKGETKAKQGK